MFVRRTILTILVAFTGTLVEAAELDVRPAGKLEVTKEVLGPIWAPGGFDVVMTDRGFIVAFACGDGKVRHIRFGEQREWKHDELVLMRNVTLSHDGKRVAYGYWKDLRHWRVVVDGVEDPVCDNYRNLSFSPDSRHVTYTAQKDLKQYIVFDGIAGPKFDGVYDGRVKFSPDGTRHTYIAQKRKKTLVVTDGKPGPEHDGVDGLAFGPKGKHVIYAAADGDKWRMVVDGKPGPALDGLSAYYIVFSPNGTRFAYVGFQEKIPEKKCVAVIDGVAQPPCYEIDDLKFSPDGKHVAYTETNVSEEKGWRARVVLNGESGPEFTGVWEPFFSPDGKGVKYAALEGRSITAKTIFMVNGQRQDPKLPRAGIIFWSPNGKRYLCMTSNGLEPGEGGKGMMIVDGQQGPEFDEVSTLKRSQCFSPDSKHVVYEAKEGDKHFVILDGRKLPAFDGVWMQYFSKDCKHLAYLAGDQGQKRVVIDGRPGPRFASIEEYCITFSPKSDSIAYVADKTTGHSVLVVDGHESQPIGGLWAGPAYRADGVVECITVQDDTVYRVTAKPPGMKKWGNDK
ncbi:MAG: hypothetical protein JW818_17435 [Pirellulales bacterium]|nr:hypothetical protein [Pirellulales bacterium]